jgi:hypothetical protein
MRDYIATRKAVTSRRIGRTPQLRPPYRFSELFNRVGLTKASETANDYISFRCEEFHKLSLYRIKRFVTDYAAALRSLECAPLVSRAHCNEVRYRRVNLGGETA